MSAQIDQEQAASDKAAPARLYTESLLLRMPHDMRQQIHCLARAQGQTATEFIRESIRLHLERRRQYESVSNMARDELSN